MPFIMATDPLVYLVTRHRLARTPTCDSVGVAGDAPRPRARYTVTLDSPLRASQKNHRHYKEHLVQDTGVAPAQPELKSEHHHHARQQPVDNQAILIGEIPYTTASCYNWATTRLGD
jgi:hypothetical protein